jgi:hypothetical protein
MGSAGWGAKGMPALMLHPRSWRLLLLLPLLLAASPQQRSADTDTRAMLQANYIYNIAKLVEWRDPAMRSGNFVVGIIGGSNVYEELIKKYSTKTIGKQPLEVMKLPRTADVQRCHILFVAATDLALLPDIYRNLKGRPVLVITEYQGALDDGAVVNFVNADNTLKYEISIRNASAHQLEVGSTLKQLALRVQE